MAEDPMELHDRFEDRVNMTVGELEAFGDSDNYEVYSDRKNAGQPIDEPRGDVIRLLETPINWYRYPVLRRLVSWSMHVDITTRWRAHDDW